MTPADAQNTTRVGLANGGGFESLIALAVIFAVVIVNSGGTKACDSTV
jgi:hypothetical protein